MLRNYKNIVNIPSHAMRKQKQL